VPRYTYRCTHCGTVLDIFHLSDEEAGDCAQCHKPRTLEKLLSSIQTPGKKQSGAEKIGSLTEDFINQSREDLHQQKEALIKK
jgi:putative FmdB family regulatory protein